MLVPTLFVGKWIWHIKAHKRFLLRPKKAQEKKHLDMTFGCSPAACRVISGHKILRHLSAPASATWPFAVRTPLAHIAPWSHRPMKTTEKGSDFGLARVLSSAQKTQATAKPKIHHLSPFPTSKTASRIFTDLQWLRCCESRLVSRGGSSSLRPWREWNGGFAQRRGWNPGCRTGRVRSTTLSETILEATPCL